MVCLMTRISKVSLEEAIEKIKTVPPEGELVKIKV